MVGHCYGLSDEETKDLWDQVDIEGNGVLDFKEFQVNYFVPTFLFTLAPETRLYGALFMSVELDKK